MAPRIFIDLDGVLANFNKSACAVFQIPYPRDQELGYGWCYRQIQPVISVDAYLDRLAAEDDFWGDLDLFMHADRLVTAVSIFGCDWAFLSACTRHPRSYSGKVRWIQKYYPCHAKRLILVPEDKTRVCRPGDILIDDSEKNCTDWNRTGGYAIWWRELPMHEAFEQVTTVQDAIRRRLKETDHKTPC